MAYIGVKEGFGVRIDQLIIGGDFSLWLSLYVLIIKSSNEECIILGISALLIISSTGIYNRVNVELALFSGSDSRC